MSMLFDAINKYTVTENWADTYRHSGNPLVDLFFMVGAARYLDKNLILSHMTNCSDIVNAFKILFYARDRIWGLGERRVFRTIFSSYSYDVTKYFVHLVPEYGRWDDLWIDGEGNQYTTNLDYVSQILSAEGDEPSLLAKWLPRKGIVFSTLAKKLNLSYKELRKLLVKKTNVVETLLTERRYNEINLEHVPSRSLLKYSNAFQEYMPEAYQNLFSSGKIKNEYFYPYDVFRKYQTGTDYSTLQWMWNNIKSDLSESNKNFLPVVDVSGSMNGTPMEMSVSLWLFLAERNTGIFKDHVVTFHENPSFVKIPNELNIANKFQYILDMDWGGSTNLDKVFDILLKRAVEHNIPESEMPEAIVIISDMQFDYATYANRTIAFDIIKERYKDAGYKMPYIIFWNVRSAWTNIPTQSHEGNVVLFSGSNTKNIDKIVNFDIEDVNPEKILYEMVLNNPRYDAVWAVFTNQ